MTKTFTTSYSVDSSDLTDELSDQIAATLSAEIDRELLSNILEEVMWGKIDDGDVQLGIEQFISHWNGNILDGLSPSRKLILRTLLEKHGYIIVDGDTMKLTELGKAAVLIEKL